MASSPYTLPVILHGQVLAPPNADGVLPAASLSNPLAVPLELLEVRIRAMPQPVTTVASAMVTGLGVGIKMDIGKVPIVDAYAPVGILSSARDSHDGNSIDTSVTGEVGLGTIVVNGINPAIPTVFQWRLKYPLFMPVDTAPSIVLRPLGQNQYPVLLDVIYICRTWDTSKPVPRNTRVPWVCSYKSKAFDFVDSGPAGSDHSSNLDIVNPFSQKLEVARFGGRISRLNVVNSVQPGEERSTYRHKMATITMKSSRGFDITRTQTQFGGLFPFSWRVWDLAEKWYMNPREFYTVGIQVAAVNDSVASPFQVQFGVGMVGYRTVPVAAFMEG